MSADRTQVEIHVVKLERRVDMLEQMCAKMQETMTRMERAARPDLPREVDQAALQRLSKFEEAAGITYKMP